MPDEPVLQVAQQELRKHGWDTFVDRRVAATWDDPASRIPSRFRTCSGEGPRGSARPLRVFAYSEE
jgi:hypothetical protein